MIEGGGLGVYAPEEIGPIAVQVANGVVDSLAADEAEAVALARRYLSYFQGRRWRRLGLRRPAHCCATRSRKTGLRVYDMRRVIETLADKGSVLELRAGVRRRDDHRPGPRRGPADGADRQQPEAPRRRDRLRRGRQGARVHAAVRGLRLPILSLCDTPGFMVGPGAEKTAPVRTVRACSWRRPR